MGLELFGCWILHAICHTYGQSVPTYDRTAGMRHVSMGNFVLSAFVTSKVLLCTRPSFLVDSPIVSEVSLFCFPSVSISGLFPSLQRHHQAKCRRWAPLCIKTFAVAEVRTSSTVPSPQTCQFLDFLIHVRTAPCVVITAVLTQMTTPRAPTPSLAAHLSRFFHQLDLSAQHSIHLIVSPSAEKKPVGDSSTTAVERKPVAPPLAQQQPPPQQQQQPLQPQPLLSRDGSSRSSVIVAAAPSAGAATSNGKPERIQLSQMQLGQLQLQYQQALNENERALEEHQQRFNFLSAQSRALARQQHYQRQTPGIAPLDVPQQQFQEQEPQQIAQEATARMATRALGGNMPGPAGGGGVRDVTGPPPPGIIPAAGLGEDGEAGNGNLVDPAPRAPDIGREARGWFKMVLQCIGVIIVFGIDANGWVLVLLALGGLVAFLFRTGLLKEMLGSGREGGGLWKKLCTAATVITEGNGLLMNVRYLCSAFFLSLFPK